MAQYAVEPGILAPYLPAGLELDFYEGRCFVSLVGFLFDRVRLKGVAIPFHTRFEEGESALLCAAAGSGWHVAARGGVCQGVCAAGGDFDRCEQVL